MGSPPPSPSAVSGGEGDRDDVQLNEEMPSYEIVEDEEGKLESRQQRPPWRVWETLLVQGLAGPSAFKNRECGGM